jgi:pyrroline-5-carboxylate reductase
LENGISYFGTNRKGAAEMLMEEQVHPEQLIDRVTTPKGCTIAGLNEMEMHGFSSSLIGN